MTRRLRSLSLRPAGLLPSLSRAFDTPLRTVGSLLPPGVCFPALRRLPGRDFHPLEHPVFQDAPFLRFYTTMRYAHSNHDTKARAVAKWPASDKAATQVPRRPKSQKRHSDTPRKVKESGKTEDGGMAERLNAPVLKTDLAISASARK